MKTQRIDKRDEDKENETMKRKSLFLANRNLFGGLAFFLMLLVSSCGGGGGGGSSSNSSANPSSTGSINLSWAIPYSQEDGRPFPDLAGYYIYYGTSPGNYTLGIDAGNVQTHTLQNLAPGIYYFAITAYDSSGYETDFSEEVSIGVP